MTSDQILQADMLDILFEGRNKKYGAYQLRVKKDEDHAKALLVAIIVTLAIFGYSFYREFYAIEIVDEKISEPYKFIPIVSSVPNETKDIYIPQPNSAEVTTLEINKPFIIKDNAPDPTSLTSVPDFIRKDNGQNSRNGVPNGQDIFDINMDVNPGLFEGKKPAFMPVVEEEKELFTVVEQQPEFPGGESAMYKWISQNLTYPQEAVRNGFTGKVIVQFIVENNGSITGVSVVRDAVGAGAGPEAKRIIEKMPEWKPGRQNGRNVRVQFTIPISFSLD